MAAEFLAILLLTGSWMAEGADGSVYCVSKNGGWFLRHVTGDGSPLASASLPRRPRALCASSRGVVVAYRDGGLEIRDATSLASVHYRYTSDVYMALACDATSLYGAGRFLEIRSLSWNDLSATPLQGRLHSWGCCLALSGGRLFSGSWDHAVRIHPTGRWFTHLHVVSAIDVTGGLIGVLLAGGRLVLRTRRLSPVVTKLVKGAKSFDIAGNTIVLGVGRRHLVFLRRRGRRLFTARKVRIPWNPMEVILRPDGTVFVHDGTECHVWRRR